MNKKLEGSASCAEKVARLHASAMYRGSVSTFADLSVAFGAAPCHVQRVHFWHLKSAYFLEMRWGPPLFEAPGCHLAVAMSCVTLLYVARFEQHDSREYLSGESNRPPGNTGFRMLRAQFWTLAPKVDPLRIESGPSWRVCFVAPLFYQMC